MSGPQAVSLRSPSSVAPVPQHNHPLANGTIPMEILDIIFTFGTVKISDLRLTCRRWDTWFKREAGKYIPETDQSLASLKQAYRILKIKSDHSETVFFDKAELKGCNFYTSLNNKKLSSLFNATLKFGSNWVTQSNGFSFSETNLTAEVSYLENGKRCVFQANQTEIILRKAGRYADGEIVGRFPAGTSSVYNLKQVNGKYIIAQSHDKELMVFDVDNTTDLKVLSFDDHLIESLEVCNGHLFVALGDGSVRVQLNMKDRYTILGPNNNVVVKCLKADRNNLYMGRSDGTLAVLDLSNLRKKGDELRLSKPVELGKVSSGAIQDIAADREIIFVLHETPNVISCHTYAMGKFSMINEWKGSPDQTFQRIYYGEGILAKNVITRCEHRATIDNFNSSPKPPKAVSATPPQTPAPQQPKQAKKRNFVSRLFS